MTDPTARDLIKRLSDALAEWQLGGAPPEDAADAALINEARAYLATPEPVPPTDEEIDAWHTECADLTRAGTAKHYWAFEVGTDYVVNIVRGALSRWGHQPEATGHYWAFEVETGMPDGREPASVVAQPSRADLEALFRRWWALSYPLPPGVHAVATHVGFAEWLLAGGKP